MNFRKLLFLPLVLVTLISISSNPFWRRKPRKSNDRRTQKTEQPANSGRPFGKVAAKPAESFTYSAAADPFAKRMYPWADSVFHSLTPRERLGQLFMIQAYSNRNEAHFREIDSLVTKYGVGGIIFMQGTPVSQANLTNRWQKMAHVPLMLSMDAEWGLAMRLDSVIKFPKQMTLGALKNDSLIYDMGHEVALQCQRIGMQVNFAPVADVNNNPANPVINMRSFGESKELVSRKAIAYMRGMQDLHVLATGKHFPGHGDTDTDSHLGLPVINHSRERLDTLELVPFKKLFKAGLGSVMVAHLYIPSLDTTANQASTLSPKVIKGLLRDELNYQGLVFTDALNMKGVASFYQPGAVDVKALIAGNDMLLISEAVPTAMNLIDSALVRGEITQEEIDMHCLKVLQAKEWEGLNRLKKVETANLTNDLNSPVADELIRRIKREAITLVSNKSRNLPLQSEKQVAILAIGDENPNQFQQTLSNYLPAVYFNAPKTPTLRQIQTLKDSLSHYEKVVLVISNTNILAKKNFGFTDEGVSLCNAINKQNKTSLVAFVNPYAIQRLEKIDNYESILVAYQDDDDTQIEAAQIVAGVSAPKGNLPVSINEKYPQGTGLSFESINTDRLSYAHPEELGFNLNKLAKIDSLVKNGLNKEAYPGCQVLVARKGKIIYQKDFGYVTYANKDSVKPQPVRDNSIYDLASLTKVLSTTLSAMKLADQGKLDINKTLGYYLPFIPKGHPHANILIRDAMLHQAGFPAWIPFYKSLIVTDTLRNSTFTIIPDKEHTWKVADLMYSSPALKDTIFKMIWDSKLVPSQGYKYSDIGFYYLREVVEKITKKPIEEYVQETYYQPMKLTTLGYQPLKRFARDRIVPTEYDLEFRKQLVHGYVHDQGASLLDGVSGHAGLFGNSFDVAVIMQMLVNGGEYNGIRFLKPETVKMFTQSYDPGKNRRALGFDKPVKDSNNGPTFNGISLESFGHSGFTGTFTWADPKEEIVYVFLSNRVYPSAENNKLLKMSIRSDVQEAIYKALR